MNNEKLQIVPTIRKNKTERIEDYIKSHPGLKTYEIAEALGFKRSKMISDAIFRLKSSGKIEQRGGSFFHKGEQINGTR